MLKKCEVCAKTDEKNEAAAYQSRKYGPGMRVHNPQGGKNRGKARCTVCGDTKSS